MLAVEEIAMAKESTAPQEVENHQGYKWLSNENKPWCVATGIHETMEEIIVQVDKGETWQGIGFTWNSDMTTHTLAVFNILHLPNSWDDQARWDTAVATLMHNTRERQRIWGDRVASIMGDWNLDSGRQSARVNDDHLATVNEELHTVSLQWSCMDGIVITELQHHMHTCIHMEVHSHRTRRADHWAATSAGAWTMRSQSVETRSDHKILEVTRHDRKGFCVAGAEAHRGAHHPRHGQSEEIRGDEGEPGGQLRRSPQARGRLHKVCPPEA